MAAFQTLNGNPVKHIKFVSAHFLYSKVMFSTDSIKHQNHSCKTSYSMWISMNKRKLELEMIECWLESIQPRRLIHVQSLMKFHAISLELMSTENIQADEFSHRHRSMSSWIYAAIARNGILYSGFEVSLHLIGRFKYLICLLLTEIGCIQMQWWWQIASSAFVWSLWFNAFHSHR